MPSAATDKLDAMMRKVEGLLARADHPNTPTAEADSARAMAERIMIKYKIEQEDLICRGEAVVNGLDILFKEVKVYRWDSPYGNVYQSLMAYAISHTGCYGVWTGRSIDGERVITIVGYEADIRYAEALFLSARLIFADRMEPKVDPNLSDEDNVYRLRSSGLERRVVADMMGWVKGGAKVTRLYKAACAKRGEEPVLTGQGMSVADYREGYAEAFKSEFWTRLWHARSAIEKEMEGSGLVLHGRKERILEAAYTRWPELRPSTEVTKAETKPVEYKYKPPTKAELRAMERRNNRVARAGQSAGRRAASEVDVAGQTPKRRLGE